jgi:hypothetical protein
MPARLPLAFEVGSGGASLERSDTVGWTIIRQLPGFPDGVTSNWFGKVSIDETYPSGSKIRFRVVAQTITTGNVRWTLSYAKAGSAGGTNPSYTTLTTQDAAVSGTAKTNATIEFTTTDEFTQGDTVSWRLVREGAHANDTAAATVFIWDAHLDDV